MRAGLLNEIITFQTPVMETDAYGHKVNSYASKFTTRAYIVNGKGGRGIVNDEIFYSYTKIFTIRDYNEPSERDIILWDSKKYRILSISRDKKKMVFEIESELINE